MGRIRKFLCLSPRERLLLVQSAVFLGWVRVGLSLLPLQILRRFLTKVVPRPGGHRLSDRPSVERIVWAVTTASRYVPRATCLTQALVAKALLARSGHPAHLRIGVATGEGRRLEAHAWVVGDQGRVLLGGMADLGRYTPLPSLPGEER